MEFHGSSHSSLGMEIEFQLLDSETLDLVDGILPLMECYPPFPWIKPEHNQATVEINSKVCADIKELETNIVSIFATLQGRCEGLGMTLCGAGTHPFSRRLVPMTPQKRYQALYKLAGHLGYWLTFALHIHVGMPSGDEAVELMVRLKPYFPVLLALSASSPFWWGYDTGFASFRQRLLASSRTYGIPPTFKCWQDFSAFFESARAARMFDTIRDIHWDLRLQPQLGTLEVRVMDAQPTLKESLMLAAFVHSLIVYLQCCSRGGKRGFLLTPRHWWIEKENYFRASRLGLDAIYLEDERGNGRPIKKVIEDILEALATTAERLGETEYLKLLQARLEGRPSYIRQRQIWQQTGSQKEVVASLVRELQQELLYLPFLLPSKDPPERETQVKEAIAAPIAS